MTPRLAVTVLEATLEDTWSGSAAWSLPVRRLRIPSADQSVNPYKGLDVPPLVGSGAAAPSAVLPAVGEEPNAEGAPEMRY